MPPMSIKHCKVLYLFARISLSLIALRDRYPRFLQIQHYTDPIFVVATHQPVVCVRTVCEKVGCL